jgi:hypothetical protein
MTPEAADLLRLSEWYRWRAECAAATARRLIAEERDSAIVDALQLYEGAPTTRASALADELSDYLGRAWPRERDLNALPESAPSKRRAWHRIARSRDGEALAWRRIYDISQICNAKCSTLQKQPCDSSSQANESE